MADQDLMISVLMPYYHRPTQLRNTLDSYQFFYGDIADKIEILVLDDGSPNDEAYTIVRDSGFPYAKHVRIVRPKRGNPAGPFNMGAAIAKAPLLLLTNPENMHLDPILDDAILNTPLDTYRCYACRSIRCIDFLSVREDRDKYTRRDEVAHGYYQHSVKANRLIYFCAAIRKETYHRVGGINEKFTDGYGWEDLDAIASWRNQGVKCQAIDKMEVAHQAHERFFDSDGYQRNKRIFYDRWGRGEFIYDPSCATVLR